MPRGRNKIHFKIHLYEKERMLRPQSAMAHDTSLSMLRWIKSFVKKNTTFFSPKNVIFFMYVQYRMWFRLTCKHCIEKYKTWSCGIYLNNIMHICVYSVHVYHPCLFCPLHLWWNTDHIKRYLRCSVFTWQHAMHTTHKAIQTSLTTWNTLATGLVCKSTAPFNGAAEQIFWANLFGEQIDMQLYIQMLTVALDWLCDFYMSKITETDINSVRHDSFSKHVKEDSATWFPDQVSLVKLGEISSSNAQMDWPCNNNHARTNNKKRYLHISDRLSLRSKWIAKASVKH